MHNKVIGFIGAGHLGEAIIGALIKASYDPKNIFASNRNTEKLRHLEAEFKIETNVENAAVATVADVVILCVKPQQMLEALESIKSSLKIKKSLLVSVAAGVGLTQIQETLGFELPLIRAMSNTPALIGMGATALWANDKVSDAEKIFIETLFKTTGLALWLSHEEEMDAVGALSGAGPAYVYFVMEALEAAAEKLGLPARIVNPLVKQTVLGAVQLAIQSEKDFQTLREEVTSRGGITEQGIRCLEEANVREAFSNALEAAFRRSIELGQL